MKRFDRATYLVFLLVLLADVAWAHSSMPVVGDGRGGLILGAANQLQAGPASGALRASRRSPLQVAGFRSYKLGFAGWSRTVIHLSAPAVQVVMASAPETASESYFFASSGFASPVLGMLEHAGSPAP